MPKLTLRFGYSLAFVLIRFALSCPNRRTTLVYFENPRRASMATMTSSFLNEGPYRSQFIDGLEVGRTIEPLATGGNGAPTIRGSRWYLPPGTYTPRQIVEGCAPLLETVLYNLGPDPSNTIPARKMLLSNLASNLRIDTRESTLRLNEKPSDAGREEMAKQAEKIGETIVRYAHEVTNAELDPKLDIRSPCEGHLLEPAVAGLMFGPRSQMHLMQLFNEYLHQMVLLRDALLPFYNFADVLIPIEGRTGRQLGLRSMEQSRSHFLTQLMTRRVSQNSVFEVAKSLLAPKLPSQGGYGFQYVHGLVLPAFLAGNRSLRLLLYIPARLEYSIPEVLFDYEYHDYFSAPRKEISMATKSLEAGSWLAAPSSTLSPEFLGCSLVVENPAGNNSSGRLLKISISFDRETHALVDLGQVSRGRRYAYHIRNAKRNVTNGGPTISSTHTVGFSESSNLHSSAELLTKPGPGLLTSTKGGIHIIPAENTVIGLALLGKIYPENIVTLGVGQDPKKAENTGKSFANSPKFVIYGDRWDVMPKHQ